MIPPGPVRERAQVDLEGPRGTVLVCHVVVRLGYLGRQHQAVVRYRDTDDPSALEHVDDVAWEMNEGSICGLGMVASLPLTSARQHFPEDFS